MSCRDGIFDTEDVHPSRRKTKPNLLALADALAEAVEAYRYARDELSGAPPAVRADEATKRYPKVVTTLRAYLAARGQGGK